MTDHVIPIHEQVNKKDLEVILEVNRKAVAIETAVADQNEEIIHLLNDSKAQQETMDDKLDKLITQGEDTSKDLFKIQVFFITGLLSLIVQIIQIFLRK